MTAVVVFVVVVVVVVVVFVVIVVVVAFIVACPAMVSTRMLSLARLMINHCLKKP